MFDSAEESPKKRTVVEYISTVRQTAMHFVERLQSFGRNLELSQQYFTDFQRMNEEVGQLKFQGQSDQSSPIHELQEAFDRIYDDLHRTVVQKSYLKTSTDVAQLQRSLSDRSTQ